MSLMVWIHTKQVFNLILILVCVFCSCDSTTHEKISREIHENIESGKTSNVIVEFHESSELSRDVDQLFKQISIMSQNWNDITELLSTIVELNINALSTIIQLLETQNIPFQVLWATSQIFIPEATQSTIIAISQLSIVKLIRLEFLFRRPIPPQTDKRDPPTGNKTWNIGLIDARCKDITCLGEGVIIGFTDVNPFILFF